MYYYYQQSILVVDVHLHHICNCTKPYNYKINMIMILLMLYGIGDVMYVRFTLQQKILHSLNGQYIDQGSIRQ